MEWCEWFHRFHKATILISQTSVEKLLEGRPNDDPPRKYPKRSSNLLAREEVPLELAVREGVPLGQTTFWHVRKYPSGQLTSEEVSQEVAPPWRVREYPSGQVPVRESPSGKQQKCQKRPRRQEKMLEAWASPKKERIVTAFSKSRSCFNDFPVFYESCQKTVKNVDP